MFVKVVNRKAGRQVIRDPVHCEHVVIDQHSHGVKIELCFNDAKQNIVIKLPRDGQSVYFMNDERGDTVDSVHWPPRPKKNRNRNEGGQKSWQPTASRREPSITSAGRPSPATTATRSS